MGAIFDVSDTAETLVANQRAELADLPASNDVSALWYSSGSDTPYVGAGSGAPQMIMDAIGITNIAAEVDARVTKEASGSASMKGGGAGRSPRRIRYASASTAAAITR